MLIDICPAKFNCRLILLSYTKLLKLSVIWKNQGLL